MTQREGGPSDARPPSSPPHLTRSLTGLPHPVGRHRGPGAGATLSPVLHHLHQLPLTDIAGQLGVPVGTAKSRLHTARRALERALEAES